jgi:hypothetical protein
LNAYAISQLLASVAFALGIAGFQCRGRTSLLRLMCVGIAFYAAHFFVLGQTAAGAVCCVTSVRYLVASFSHDRRLLVVFLAATWTAFLLVPSGPYGVLGVTAASFGTLGSFQRDPNRLRAFKFTCSLIWCVHNTLVESWVALAMEISFATSNAVGFLRHGTVRRAAG